MSKAAESNVYKKLLKSRQQVDARIDELAAEIIDIYDGRHPLFVCLLRGGAPFATRLMFAITEIAPQFHPELDYMTVKTYGDERTDKPSELVLDLSPSTQVKGRDVILLDDTLDKGVTAEFACNHLRQHHGVKSVYFVVLVQKKRERKTFENADLFGFELPDVWLTGMGLDDAAIAKEANRWRSDIAQAN